MSLESAAPSGGRGEIFTLAPKTSELRITFQHKHGGHTADEGFVSVEHVSHLLVCIHVIIRADTR